MPGRCDGSGEVEPVLDVRTPLRGWGSRVDGKAGTAICFKEQVMCEWFWGLLGYAKRSVVLFRNDWNPQFDSTERAFMKITFWYDYRDQTVEEQFQERVKSFKEDGWKEQS